MANTARGPSIVVAVAVVLGVAAGRAAFTAHQAFAIGEDGLGFITLGVSLLAAVAMMILIVMWLRR